MNNPLKRLLPHIVIVVLFIVTALLYFNPVLQGKQIFQSDIAQFTGMAKQQNDFRKATGEEPYWTDSAFGGMPTYQLGANYPHNYIKKLDKTIRFLPRPADYLFLYFIGFYILLVVLKVDYKLAALGALAFGFSTYLIIILGVGHNAKAHAIGYFPLVLAGILLTFQKKYIYGFLLTAIAMALEINANHFQMTYYLGLLVLVLGLVYLVDAYKKKWLKHFFTSVGVLVLAVLLGIATNATNLMATKEYADWSTRGKSNLTINTDGSKKEASTSGLSKEYITEYSYGISESLNLFVPRLFGGGNSENVGENSETYNFLVTQGVDRRQAKEFAEGLPTYWGDQPIVAGPAYVGAVVCFLFVLGLFLVKGRLKWWLVGGTLLSLLLSWGKNLGFLTDFMIDYFPMYNKFRAVSSIQVILEMCAPILAVFALVRLFNDVEKEERKFYALKWTSIIVGGLGIALFLGKGMFDFVGSNDGILRQYYGNEIVETIKEDRMKIYTQDVLRSLLLVALVAGCIWLFLKQKLKEVYLVVAIGALLVIDLVGVDRRYVNNDDFVQSRRVETPFVATPIDKQIQEDKGHYRVFEPSSGLAGARASYFHKAIGGYHAAKPGRFNELYDFHIAKGNQEALNMLNVKYIIAQDQNGQLSPQVNGAANGNAWFVTTINKVDTADDEILSLSSINAKTDAIFNNNDFEDIQLKERYTVDSTATIALKSYQPNKLVYESNNSNDGVAVFSEMYYPHGWKVTINGKEAKHFRVNYLLRALQVPAGKHTITFSFEPEVVKKGSTIALASTVILGLVLVGGLYYENRKKPTEVDA